MFTNGDNMYNKHWLDSVARLIVNSTSSIQPLNSNATVVDIVGWDFVTHHMRKVTTNPEEYGIYKSNQLIQINPLRRGYVDLGSIMIRSHLYSTMYTASCNSSDSIGTIRDIDDQADICEYSHVRFLPYGKDTSNIFARDYFTLQVLIQNSLSKLRPNSNDNNTFIQLIHQILMFHQ